MGRQLDNTKLIAAGDVRGAEATTDVAGLVRRARAGDSAAFDELIQRYQDMAVGFGAALLGDFHLAEDAAQEAFLEMHRTLPALRVPEAFGGCLRLAVRKHCDRITRRKRVATAPLDSAYELGSADCVGDVLARERQRVVRAAVRELPERERVVVVLYYVGERSVREVGAFLEVPVSTVKNRLHGARRRLRERLLPLMEDTPNSKIDTALDASLHEQRPSRDDRFHGRVIARLFDEYLGQFRVDMQTADRGLLAQAREELDRAGAEGVPDRDTAHAGIRLLIFTHDYVEFPDLMDRYLAQPLPPAEELWAKWTRIRGLTMRQDAAAAVAGQRDLMATLRRYDVADLRLSADDPFLPTDDPSARVLAPEAVPLLFLGTIELGENFALAGVFDEWLEMLQETVASVPATDANRLFRFYRFRHAGYQLVAQKRLAESWEMVSRTAALAEEDQTWQSPRWPIEALFLALRIHEEAGDTDACRATAREATHLLQALWAGIDIDDREQRGVTRVLTHNLAAPLTLRGDYDLALPLWERLTDSRQANEWAYLWYAECVWATTHDRERTLSLLREAAGCAFDDSIGESYRQRPGFADVRDDAEFQDVFVRAKA